MKTKILVAAAALLVAVAVVAGLASPSKAAKPGSGSVPVPVTGTASPGALPVAGTFQVSKFKVIDGTLTAIGTFVGTVDGQQVSTAATAPVSEINGNSVGAASTAAQAAATCEVLDLTLGPLHLDLLGLVVDLNQVHLTITAEQGPGNLLGNLLCAVTGLLDNTGGGGGGALNGIANLLNQIIGILNGL